MVLTRFISIGACADNHHRQYIQSVQTQLERSLAANLSSKRRSVAGEPSKLSGRRERSILKIQARTAREVHCVGKSHLDYLITGS